MKSQSVTQRFTAASRVLQQQLLFKSKFVYSINFPLEGKSHDAGMLRAVLHNSQLSSFGQEKMKFLKLSQMNGLDK